MCGIAGYYSKTKPIASQKFEEMVDIIAYRGPDDRGIYSDRNLMLGHRRLSIIDLSKSGHQPFVYIDRYVLVYNGEIYNYKEIKRELILKGYSFLTETDTEVLIAAYDYWGQKCLDHFNGMWAFAIYDKTNQNIYAARDRFGIKPFYYYWDKESFAFGSEIKQLLLVKQGKHVANRNILLEFLIHGICDHTDQTMFKDIMQLQAGEELFFDIKQNTLKKNRYYRLEYANRQGKAKDKIKEQYTYENACIDFEHYFTDSVRLRMRADVPIGYCLSGGLDSSAIACTVDSLMKKGMIAKTEQHAVSSCFEEKAYDEQEYVDEVISQTEITAHKIFPDMYDMLNKLDKIIWHMDEPVGSASIYAQWSVFQEAAEQGIKVMLDGQGSDEQLAGYTGFYNVLFIELIKRFEWKKCFYEIEQYLRLRAGTEKHINPYREILSVLVTAAIPESLKNWLAGKILLKRDLPFSKELISENVATTKWYRKKDSHKYILDNMYMNMQGLFHYEDRNSMAFSIESRVPFVDYRLAELLYRIPLEYKIKGGITKAVMREALKNVLPEKIRKRYDKLGFVTPEDMWINENADLVRDELVKACEIVPQIFDRDIVLAWYDKRKVKSNRGDHLIWRIICIAHWTKIFDVVYE